MDPVSAFLALLSGQPIGPGSILPNTATGGGIPGTTSIGSALPGLSFSPYALSGSPYAPGTPGPGPTASGTVGEAQPGTAGSSGSPFLAGSIFNSLFPSAFQPTGVPTAPGAPLGGGSLNLAAAPTGTGALLDMGAPTGGGGAVPSSGAGIGSATGGANSADITGFSPGLVGMGLSALGPAMGGIPGMGLGLLGSLLGTNAAQGVLGSNLSFNGNPVTYSGPTNPLSAILGSLGVPGFSAPQFTGFFNGDFGGPIGLASQSPNMGTFANPDAPGIFGSNNPAPANIPPAKGSDNPEAEPTGEPGPAGIPAGSDPAAAAAAAGVPGESSGGMPGVGDAPGGSGGGDGGSGSLLCNYALGNGACDEKTAQSHRRAFGAVAERAFRENPALKESFGHYKQAARPIIDKIDTLDQPRRKAAMTDLHTNLVQPFAKAAKAGDVMGAGRILRDQTVKLAKTHGVTIPQPHLDLAEQHFGPLGA